MNKSKKTILNTVFLGIFTLSILLNVTIGQTKTDKIEELISKCEEYGKFNGSVLVAEKGEIIYEKGFGLANMEWGVPNRPDTKFRLASVTKQFTAMLIIQLVAENKLKLDVPISTYFPDYPKKHGDRITIHHLLTHTSGTPNYTSFSNYREMMRNPHRPADIVSLFADSTLEFNPGEKFAYSNSGYVLLGVIIEKMTGKTFEQVLQEKIFTPLKMNNTGYDQNSLIIKNRAAGYYRNGNHFVNANYIDMSTPYAAGAMYSTVEDLFLWDQALYTEKLAPKKYMDLLFEKHTPAWGQHYGYGWEIGNMPIGNTKEQLQTIRHGGTINGFNTQITRIPSDKSLILLLNNTGEAPLYDMTTDIIGILHDKPYNFPKKSMAYSLLDAIEKDGITTTLLNYKEFKESSEYYLDENEMNLSGYQLLQSGRAKEAAAVFKLNIEAFPNSFNTYDSYGEVLLVIGDTIQAIENYKKSVQLNPDNENGIKILKNLGINTESLIIKVPIENLKLLVGEYMATDQNREWKIKIEEVDGVLFGNDGGYRYKLNPVGDNKFINPDDGASLVFDTEDKNAITFVIFGRVKFKKMYLTDYDPYFIETKTITTSYGPSSITRNIIQDRDGNIWFATWEGIIRYDGVSFTNFTNKEGLRRFHVFAVLEDKAGNIWFGTIGAGVYRYDGKTFTNFTTKEGLVHDRLGCIYEDKTGNIWFGTEGGISIYDGNSFRNFTTNDGLTNNDINSIIEDKNGIFWFGTRGDACYYDPAAHGADGKMFTNFKNKDGASFKNVRSVIEDKKGNIWLGGNDGLWRYDGKSFTNFTTDFVGYIYEDKKGNIWTSSDGDNTHNWVLTRYDVTPPPLEQVNDTQMRPQAGMLFGISEDTNGNIWLGTMQGICRYDGKSFNYFKEKETKE